MANTTSDLMGNLLASPIVPNFPRESGGALRWQRATLVVAGTEAIGHLFPIARLDARDRVRDILIGSTALGGTVTADFGVYVSGDWTVADQALKVVDVYANLVDLTVADLIPRSVLGSGAAANSAPNFWEQLWEDAGDVATPTPGVTYDLVMGLTAVTGLVSGTVQVVIEYTSG